MAGSLQNTLSFMFVAIYYHGMLNNTNNIERIIRHHHVRPRSTRRLLDCCEKCGHPVYATCRLNRWIPGDILSRKRGFDPFSAGVPPPIFHSPGRAGKQTASSRNGPPLTLIERINNAK